MGLGKQRETIFSGKQKKKQADETLLLLYKLFILCTGAFLCVCFLLISNKLCDVSLLHCNCSGRYRDVGGGEAVWLEIYTPLDPGSWL